MRASSLRRYARIAAVGAALALLLFVTARRDEPKLASPHIVPAYDNKLPGIFSNNLSEESNAATVVEDSQQSGVISIVQSMNENMASDEPFNPKQGNSRRLLQIQSSGSTYQCPAFKENVDNLASNQIHAASPKVVSLNVVC